MATDNKDPFADLPSINATSSQSVADPFESMPSTSGEQYSKLGSAALGAVQGGTLGFADEAEGAGRALINAPGNKKSLKELYQQYRDIARQRYEEAQRENPKSFLAGQVASGAALSAIPGLGVAEGASMGATAANAAALGGVAGLGSSNADLTKGQVGQAALDTGVGAGIGGTLGAAGKAVSNAISPEALENTASNAAIRSIGAKTIPKNQAAGTALLENDALPFIGGAKATQNAAQSGIDKFESQLQPLLENAKTKLAQTTDFNSPQEISDYSSFSQGLKDDVDSIINFESKRDPNAGESIKNSLKAYLGEIQEAGNDPVALNDIKREMYQQIKAMNKNAYSDVTTAPKVQAYQAIAAGLKNRVEDLAEKAGVGLGDQVSDINQQMGGLINANKLLGKSIDKQAASPPGQINPSFSDLLKFGGLGAATNPVVAGGAYLAKTGIEKATDNTIGSLANNALAKGAYGLSKISGNYQNAPNAVAQALAPATSETVNSITNKPTTVADTGTQINMENMYAANPEQLKHVSSALVNNVSTKNLGGALDRAIDNNDDTGKNAAIFAIMQNPNARALLKKPR